MSLAFIFHFSISTVVVSIISHMLVEVPMSFRVRSGLELGVVLHHYDYQNLFMQDIYGEIGRNYVPRFSDHSFRFIYIVF